MAVIPFYGVDRPDIFSIERRAMDRAGLVIEALGARLPAGDVLDVGAGDGFTAELLTTGTRRVVLVEPARAMIDKDRRLPWVQAEAEFLPFADSSFDGAYSTWAYFFTRNWDPSPGVAELHRVVKPGGPLLVVENLGPDEFTSLAPTDITADPKRWASLGFACEPIETHFEFDTVEEAQTLLGFYFGERGRNAAALQLSFRPGLFHTVSSGSSLR